MHELIYLGCLHRFNMNIKALCTPGNYSLKRLFSQQEKTCLKKKKKKKHTHTPTAAFFAHTVGPVKHLSVYSIGQNIKFILPIGMNEHSSAKYAQHLGVFQCIKHFFFLPKSSSLEHTGDVSAHKSGIFKPYVHEP